jgi:hypothetical protein
VEQEIGSKGQRTKSSNKPVEKHRRRATFSGCTDDDAAVDQHHDAVVETASRANYPLDVPDERPSLLKIDVVRGRDTNREDHTEVVEVKPQVVARPKMIRRLLEVFRRSKHGMLASFGTKLGNATKLWDIHRGDCTTVPID